MNHQSRKKQKGKLIPFPSPKPAAQPALSREQLIESHMDLARSIAAAIKRRLPPFIRLEDLVSEAYMGLCQAADHYQPQTKVPFSAFARRRVAGAVIDSVRRRNFKHTSTLQLSEFPDQVRSCQIDVMGPVEEELDQASRSEIIQDAIARVPDPLHRKILELRYLSRCADCVEPVGCGGCPKAGMTGKASGKVIGIGESRSSQLHQHALASLKRTLQGTPHFDELEKTA